jgi:hypothetical protein
MLGATPPSPPDMPVERSGIGRTGRLRPLAGPESFTFRTFWPLTVTFHSRQKIDMTAPTEGNADHVPGVRPNSGIANKSGRAMSDQDLKAELERLRNENAALKKGSTPNVRMKVSEKGAVSVYGMGRFPVTLYKEQWLKLLDMSDEIRAFIAANEAQLKSKE